MCCSYLLVGAHSQRCVSEMLNKAAGMAYRELVTGDIIGCGINLGNSHCLVVNKGFTHLQHFHPLCTHTMTMTTTNTAVIEIRQQASHLKLATEL